MELSTGVRAAGSGSDASGPGLAPVTVAERAATAVVEAAGHRLAIARILPSALAGRETLAVVWDGGRAIGAAVS